MRDTVVCLQAHENKLYHLGLTNGVKKSTLADANETRDWRIYAEFAQVLIKQARPLCQGDEEMSIELDNFVYALDATTIDARGSAPYLRTQLQTFALARPGDTLSCQTP
ncbi:MAG: hypothetical protein H6566_10030 [Lewinellaceae bacterium]|nr:hypothetical protein [Lewinellaceae bacterium]